MQAANFMADKWLLNRLCQLAARRVFELPEHPSRMYVVTTAPEDAFFPNAFGIANCTSLDIHTPRLD